MATFAIANSFSERLMQTRQGAVLESLRGVEKFLDENAERLADVVDTGARRKLDEILAELETHAIGVRCRRQTVRSRTSLLRRVRDGLARRTRRKQAGNDSLLELIDRQLDRLALPARRLLDLFPLARGQFNPDALLFLVAHGCSSRGKLRRSARCAVQRRC